MLFQGDRGVVIIVYILILSTLAGLSDSFICTFQRLLKLHRSPFRGQVSVLSARRI